MMAKRTHPWPQTAREAIALQRSLGAKISPAGAPRRIRYIAGIDVGFEQNRTVARAAVAVLAFPSMELVETHIARQPVRFPYVPGLLSFRELPVVLAALERIDSTPELIMCDGHGRAHPRRFGLACHLGYLLDCATIGVAKSRLCGEDVMPGAEKGARAPLVDTGEVIGTVLRTRTNIRPVYVSTGHRIGLARAEAVTLACATRYRLPEPTRLADRLTRD